MCEWTDYAKLYNSKTQAERAAGDYVVPQPLFRAPPQPRGWLTAEEREALRWVCSITPIDMGKANEHFDALRAILARSSPPEVVLPGTQVRYHNISVEDQRDAQWIAALAAAGVAVREVPRE
jgi:hypothetical protein